MSKKKTSKISSHMITVAKDNGITTVTYHETAIVVFDNKEIMLNNGGYFSPTTKKRMNQVAEEYSLPYFVYQEKKKWWVRVDHVNGFTYNIPYSNGIKIILDQYGLAHFVEFSKVKTNGNGAMKETSSP